MTDFPRWLSLHGLVTISSLLVYVVATHVLRQRRQPSAAIGWVLFILLLPYLALPLYLLFGTRKLTRGHQLAGPGALHTNARDDERAWPLVVAAALGQPAPAAYHALRLHADGAHALRALLEVIDGAQYTLDLCTFVLGRDAVGAAVSARLAARAAAGVRVRLMVDGVGRFLGGHPDLSALRRAGVLVELFVPPFHAPGKGRTNLRNHRKFVIADAGDDAERLWCGGRNLAADYFQGHDGVAGWHDLTLDLRGPLTRQAADLFQKDWNFTTGVQPKDTRRQPVAAPAGESPGEPPGEPAAQLIASGPDQADDTLYTLLVSAAYRARVCITLVSPYVVPDDTLVLALSMAARRGVQVDLLLPAHSNHRLADVARHRALRALAAAGVHVWLAPHMLHAKLAIVDDVLALAGSTNLDGRSLFLNYEAMLAFHDPHDVARFGAWFDRECASASAYVAHAPGLARDIGEGLVLWIGFQL